MNRLLFRAKRTHHSCLRVSRAILGDALTPARFDMLYVLEACDPGRYGVLQKELCVILGVSGATVSRMLKSLRELGYVYTGPDEDEPRRHVVSLSPSGRALIRELVEKVHGSGIDVLLLDCALGAERWWKEGGCADLRAALDESLQGVTRFFGDRAILDYDHPLRALGTPM
jgi:DNA-binding MarR family transcriptional regulator